MVRTRFVALLFAAAIPLTSLSCAEEKSLFTDESFPLCEGVAAGGLRIVGTVDAMSIDVTLPNGGGGLTQINGGEIQYQGSFESDPTMPDLRLSWPTGLVDDKVGDATGIVRLPVGAFAGPELCAGDGTKVRIPGDDSRRRGMFQFRAAGLRSGDGCSNPHAGELLGCMGD